MLPAVPPEVVPGAKILIVGRDPGEQEVLQGRPFVGPSGQLLDRCLGLAGLRRGKDVSITNLVGTRPPGNVFARHDRADVERGISSLRSLIERTRPVVVVSLGNEAAYGLIDDWPSKSGDIFGATGIQERRGYFHQSDVGLVMPTLHPSAILRGRGRGQSATDEMLFTYDIERAKDAVKGWAPPEREVIVVSSPEQARAAAAAIRAAPISACDIECSPTTLACVGFAPSPSLAYVFTPASFEVAFELLRDPSLRLVFHNGQFDTYFLRTRCGVEVPGFSEDTIVSFHTCWPDLAGKGERASKRTQKSLKFLASLYTYDSWWKDYEFENLGEMYRLNGIDCMVTLEIHFRLERERLKLGIPKSLYQHEVALLRPLTRMLERGLRVDRDRLASRLAALDEAIIRLSAELEEVVEPILAERRERLSNPGLLWKIRTCPCCRNGKGKRDHCWACAGFESKPSKAALVATGADPKRKVAELLDDLPACKVCEGRGQWEVFEFNYDSTDQKMALLYEALGVPPRYIDGRPSVAEDKLKDILGTL